jgi:hypothetical protein
LLDAVFDIGDDAFDGTDDVFEHAGVSSVISEFPA